MRAAVLRAPHQVEVQEIPVPTIQDPTDVLVKVEKTAICGTDLHPYEGRVDLEADVVLGHEFIGTVTAAGSAVSRFSDGDRLVAACTVTCGSCYQCRRRQPGNCQMNSIYGLGLALGDVQGAQAEYVRVPLADINARALPVDGAGNDEDFLFVGDIMTTGYEAVARSMRGGDTVAIIGGGPVGLCAAMAARVLGAGQVLVLDQVPSRLATIAEYGFTAIDASAGEQTDAVLDLTDWRGADVVVDAVGHPSALLSAIDIVRAGGQLSIPGVYTEASIELPFGDLYLKGVTIRQGVANFTEWMDEVLSLTVAGQLSPSSIVSHRMGLSEAPEAYKLFETREATKIVLDPSR